MAKQPVSPAQDDGAWIEYDLSRYRWNLSDGDRPLRGHVVNFEKLPDGKGGSYPAIVIHLTQETIAKNDKGELVSVPAGKHVILSASEGLNGIMPDLVEMAGNPTMVREVEIKRSGTARTAAGFNVNKVSFRARPTGVPRADLPPTPSYARFNGGDNGSFEPAQLEGVQSPAGGYAG